MNAYNVALFCYLLMIVSFGGTWHSMFDYREPPVEAEVLNTYTWEDLTISGTVKQIKQTSTGKVQIDVAADSTIFPGDIPWPKSYKLRAVLDPADLSFPTDLQLGDCITFLAMVYPLEGKSNPHDFDYKQYLASKRIYTQVGIQKIFQIQPTSETISWAKFRQLVLDLNYLIDCSVRYDSSRWISRLLSYQIPSHRDIQKPRRRFREILAAYGFGGYSICTGHFSFGQFAGCG